MRPRIAHSDAGDGPPLLVLHGLLGDRSNWRGPARRLTATHRVVCADARSHGESEAAADMGYPAQAADVRALLDELGIGDAVVLGHSMGGKTAMTLALQHPDRVRALIVVDIAPLPSPDRFSPLFASMRAIDVAALESRSEADAALAAAVPETPLRSFLLKNLVRSGGGFRWRVDLDLLATALPAITDFPFAPGEARYEGPTLFVRGAESGALDADGVAAARELFPAAGVRTIGGAGHWPHTEAPEAFMAALTEFLGGLPEAGR